MKFAIFGNTYQAKNHHTQKHYSAFWKNTMLKYSCAENFITFWYRI